MWKIPYSISHLAHIASAIRYFIVPRKNPCDSIVRGIVLPLKGVLGATCIQMHTAAFLGTSATQTARKEAVLAVGSLLKAIPAGQL